jgi:hypothetical protein
MNILNETELQQANGGFLRAIPFISTKALVWAGVKAAAPAVAKTTVVAGSAIALEATDAKGKQNVQDALQRYQQAAEGYSAERDRLAGDHA